MEHPAQSFIEARPVPAPQQMRAITSRVYLLAHIDPVALTIEQEMLLDLFRAYIEVVTALVKVADLDQLTAAARAAGEAGDISDAAGLVEWVEEVRAEQ